jgi:hypothetical protein
MAHLCQFGLVRDRQIKPSSQRILLLRLIPLPGNPKRLTPFELQPSPVGRTG